MFLTVLPKHLILFILDEWLCSWNDFSSLDLAMINKELRFYLYAPNSHDSIGKINNDITITIKNGENFASLMNWKEKRLVAITKLCLNCLDKYNLFGYCMLGNKFSTLMELEISNSDDVQLQFIFYGSLPNLIKFSMKECSILICHEALILDKIFPVTNIKELLLDNIVWILQGSGSKVKPLQKVSLAGCTKLYLWIAKCCPELIRLKLDDCYGTHYTNMIPMLQALPALKDVSYWVSSISFRRLLTNSPESAATFQDILPLPSDGGDRGRQYHLPHITSLDIIIYGLDAWVIMQVLEVMFQGCDLRELQSLSFRLDADIPSNCYDRLMQYLSLHGHHLKSICLDIADENPSPLLAAICKYCTSLENWEFNSLTIEDSTFTCLSLPNTLSNLHSLVFTGVSMSNASMEMICRSSVASQLTKLSLTYVNLLSLEAYHLIVHSFRRLQYLEIATSMRYNFQQQDDAEHRDCIRSIVQLLDELFSRQCVFADTIETISLTISNDLRLSLDWAVCENASFANELFHDHMLKHWHFPFPALQSFSMTWRISHPYMNGLIMRKLLNCTKLHSIELDLWNKKSRNLHHQVINIKNRPEVIRQMREKEGY